ncbi:MAG: HD domain-containing phosphohydrolase [Thermoleophilia bacterium]
MTATSRQRALLAVLGVALAIHLLSGVGVLRVPAAATEGLYFLVMTGAAGLCVARALRGGSERAAWSALAGGMILWTIADVAYGVLYGADGVPPFPNVTDGLYLAYYAATYAGVVLLLSARLRPFRRSLWIDGLVTGLTLAAFAAAFAFEPLLHSTEGDPLTVAVTLGYPVADLLLIAFVGLSFALTRWRPDRTWSLIAASFASTAVADAVYAYTASSQTYVAGQITDTLWAASALLMAIAAWQPRAAAARGGRAGGGVVATGALALASLGLLIGGWFAELLPAAGVLAALALLAAVARAGLMFGENVRLLHASRGEALTDVLTGLGNRRRLLQALEDGFAARARPRTLVFFDLDGFKSYNDAFGHVAGDALLVRLAGKLGESVEGAGAAYRLGGDEFCVLLDPPAGRGDAVIAAACAALEERGDAFSITAPFGIAQLPREAADAEQAVRLADERMYADKESRRGAGRNQAYNVLVQVLMEREPDLHEHLLEVATHARRTAIELGMRSDELDEVVRAAELHDIGKIAVPDSVLHKPGPLDEGEWQLMREHPVVGERILATVPALRTVGLLVRHSHESWDGSGYPDHLEGTAIPLGARIIAVCDAFDAMTAQRPYAPPRSPAEALRELRCCAGTHFDPAVVEVFCRARTALRPEQPLSRRA